MNRLILDVLFFVSLVYIIYELLKSLDVPPRKDR